MAVRGPLALDRNHRGPDGSLRCNGARSRLHHRRRDRQPDDHRRDRRHPHGDHRAVIVLEGNILR